MDNREKIISLYRKYGFEYRKDASNGDFLAFTFKSGFFHNAEIVSLNFANRKQIEEDMEKSATELETLGFSTKKAFYKNVDEIEKTLFEGFFNVKDWKEKVTLEYGEHCDRILSVLPKEADTYSYINVPYSKNNRKSESNIVKDICDSLSIDGPQLNIIEAPAGFGKTCTSYEIINSLVKDYEDAPIPFFTEFSRDRQARVFNHIFVREVDRSFSSVNSDVVIDEVKQGKIVVVLDGFDELLHDKSDAVDEDTKFEDAEPMLETIGELLTCNAKIIITSRRSAIFDGSMFNEWMYRYEDKFSINRYKLEKPEINDWLQEERLDALNKTTIEISKLANPVLLSFLRFVNNESFETFCESPSKIVDYYFSSMLEREMERQELRMKPSQQTELLKYVAADMCSKNYTADSKEKIIKVIKDKGGELLSDVRTLYSPKERPTIDNLATRLSNHAFFDRSNQGENNIQFINEFVFGNYIAEDIFDTQDWLAGDERFVEPAVMSYQAREEDTRRSLWDKLSSMKDFLDASSRMKFEAALLDRVDESAYSNSDITSISIKAISLFTSGKIENSIFKECVFSNVHFALDSFKNVTFLNCSFWNCDFKNSDVPDVNFFNCRDNNEFIERIEQQEENDNDIEVEQSVQVYIFSKIWPVGSQSIERLHFFTGNLFRTNEFSRKEIIKEIKRLKREGFLLTANDTNFVMINKDKIVEIKAVLGRV